VIQNIKTFPSDNLNDLIYLVKKYRAKHKLKLCLMLGIQSNSYEDLMSKISITTSNFIIVKKFYFPSMKKILLEVIYRLLKSDKTAYMFGHNFLNTIIENIQVYGMSLEKFKRIMHYLLANFFFNNDYFFVNGLFNDAKDKVDKEQIIEKDTEYFSELKRILSKNQDLIRDIDRCLATNKKYQDNADSDEYTGEELVEAICVFYKK